MSPVTHAPTGPLWRAFLVFVLPMIAQSVLQSLSMTMSAIVVGRVLGKGEFAAMASFMPIVFFFIAFLIGLTAGASILIGQAAGAQKPDLIRRIAATTISTTLTIGVLIALAGGFMVPWFTEVLSVPHDMRGAFQAYASATFLTMPVIFMFILAGALLRGMRDTLRPLVVQLIATMFAIILTYTLIEHFHWGVRAAAWSQAIAQGTGLLALALWLRRMKDHPLAPNAKMWAQMLPDRELLSKILKLGLPTGVQVVIGSATGLIIVGLVNGFGSDATAAFGAVNQVQAYVQFPALSIGIAASIFGAQMIGAGRADRLGQVVRTAQLMNLLLTGSLVMIVMLMAYPIVGLFLTDPEVREMAAGFLHIVTWSSILFGAATIFSGVMRASGTVIVPMMIAIGSIVLVELPIAVVLSRMIGLQGVWWGYVGGFLMLLVAQFSFYNWIWRKKTITALV